MEVVIKEEKFTYEPAYKTNKSAWSIKNTDAFQIVNIGGTKCFIKRFETPPPALQLLLDLRAQPVKYIPKIYDVVATDENQEDVYYIFVQCIEGKVLKDYISENKPIDTKKISREILEGLEFIHNQGYWFGDFNEENIFYSDDGPLLLIDLDSCWPNDIRPDAVSGKDGFLPGAAQEYAVIVMQFYREILNIQEFSFHDIEGKNLNCLQLLALIAKLEKFLENKKINPKTTFVNKKIYKDLHYFLLNKNEPYCKSIFKKALTSKLNLNYKLVLEYSKFLTGENKLPPNRLPVIEYFEASNYNIFSRNSTELRWSVKNATAVFLSQASDNIQQNVAAESAAGVRPESTETYSLTAINDSDHKVINTIQVNVTELHMPEIKAFGASKLKVRKGEIVSLSWSVQYASKLFLNDTKCNLNSTGTIVKLLATSIYTLNAENRAGEKVSSEIEIEVTSLIKWWITILVLLVIAFLIWWAQNSHMI